MGNPSLIAETDFQIWFIVFLYTQKDVLFRFRKEWSAQISERKIHVQLWTVLLRDFIKKNLDEKKIVDGLI